MDQQNSMQEETSNVELNEYEQNTVKKTSFVKPSFDNIDPRNLPFKFGFRCSLSTAGQVIQGLSHTARYLLGTEEYSGNGKPMTNKFQEFLYPKISELSNEIVNKFIEKFVDGVTDPLTREVYGANLNGSGNNGQLPNSITCTGISRNVRYEYVQFKNAVSLLNYRLAFIAKRDSQSIKRYRDNQQEMEKFESLKVKAQEFCNYLESEVFVKWEDIKTEARKFNDNVSLKKETVVHPIHSEQSDQHQQFKKLKQFKKSTDDPVAVKLTADNVNSISQSTQPGNLPSKPTQYKKRVYNSHDNNSDDNTNNTNKWEIIKSKGSNPRFQRSYKSK